METSCAKLTVLFEEPFWVGVYEREDQANYSVCKITFGAEPKMNEIYEFLLENWNKLKFGATMKNESVLKKKINPKRLQRDVKKQVKNVGIGTKAQQALKMQHEQGKEKRKMLSKQQKEMEKERKFLLQQEKRKNKHRGH